MNKKKFQKGMCNWSEGHPFTKFLDNQASKGGGFFNTRTVDKRCGNQGVPNN